MYALGDRSNRLGVRDAGTAMSAPANVVVAAGGLRTRVADWARMIPKEFYPGNGRPGVLHLLDEIAAIGPARVVVVYHPYYERFIGWASRILSPGGFTRYQTLAGQPPSTAQAVENLDISFVRQHGRYADITSVLNGASHLRTDELFAAFADNLYPRTSALALLADAAPGTPAVLARPFHIADAAHRGVIICSGTDAARVMTGLVEKPDPDHAAELVDRYGAENLRLLEGRARLTAGLLRHLMATASSATPGEPKLSLSIAAYAAHHPVQVITTVSPVVDLGSPPELAWLGTQVPGYLRDTARR